MDGKAIDKAYLKKYWHLWELYLNHVSCSIGDLKLNKLNLLTILKHQFHGSAIYDKALKH